MTAKLLEFPRQFIVQAELQAVIDSHRNALAEEKIRLRLRAGETVEPGPLIAYLIPHHEYLAVHIRARRSARGRQ